MKTLGGAIVSLRQAFPEGAVREGEQEEEDPREDEDGAGGAHAGHGPGELVVQRHGVVAGQQGQHRLVEHHDGQQDEKTWVERERQRWLV